jgi:hypothetical protein
MFDKESAFLKAHERLIIAVLLLGVIVFGIIKYLNYASHNADLKAQASAAVLAAQVQANVALKAQADSDRAAYAQQVAALSQANQRLTNAISALQATLKKQQQVDQTLPLPDLANRWNLLANLQTNDTQVVSGGILASEAGARKTVQTLENVPILTQELADERQIVANKDTQTQACQKSLDSQTALVGGLQTQIKDATKSCNDQLAKLRADGRKSKAKWFVAGFVGGIATRILVKW